MASKSSANAITIMLFMVVCMGTLVPFGLTQLAPEPMLAPAGMPPAESPEMGPQCCIAVRFLEECFLDIVRYFSGCSGAVSVSRDCCIAINVIDQECYPKIFAFNFPLILKSYCAVVGGSGGAPEMLH